MRIIDKVYKKIKPILESPWLDHIMWPVVIFFIGVSSFSLGVLYQNNRLKTLYTIDVSYSSEAEKLWNEYHKNSFFNQEYFASKNGSLVYPVDCTKGDRVKKENRIYFADIEDALEQGYSAATGC